jgi:hypothetical protein
MYPPWLHYQVNNNAPINGSSLVYSIRSKAVYFIEVEHTSACYGRARTHGQNTVAHHWKLLQFSQAVCARWSFFVVFGPTKRLCRAVDSVRKKAHTHTHSHSLSRTHTIIHCKENSNDVFPEIKLRGLVPNFHIYTSVIYLCILRIYLHVLLQPNRQTNHGNICICKSLTEIWTEGRAVSFMGIFFSDFWYMCEKHKLFLPSPPFLVCLFLFLFTSFMCSSCLLASVSLCSLPKGTVQIM